MAIGATIKTIQDIMRKDTGVDGDAQRIGQLVWMLFLKVLDDREVEKEMTAKRGSKYKSPTPEELRWGSWAGNPEGISPRNEGSRRELEKPRRHGHMAVG